jgi:hypothetical protein
VEQGELLEYAVTVLERLRITYMVVGSFTSGAYGEPRFTNDIDIVVDLRSPDVKPLCEAFPPDRFYLSEEAARGAVASGGQFNVIEPESGNKIDFMIARRDPWGREQLSRRQRLPFLPKLEAFAARPEDIIISKLIYFEEGGSDKHLRDIAGIFAAGTQAIDRQYIERWVQSLNLANAWNAVLGRLGQ